MDIFTKAALVIRLRLETASLNYHRTLADIERLEAQDTRDIAVMDQLIYAYAYRDRYESVWCVARSASEASV